MVEGIRRDELLEEEPHEGEMCICAEWPAENVFYMPSHNGVHSLAIRTALCEACSMEIAEMTNEYFEKTRVDAEEETDG